MPVRFAAPGRAAPRIAAVVAAGLAIAGCGGGGDSASNPTTATPAPTARVAGTTAPATTVPTSATGPPVPTTEAPPPTFPPVTSAPPTIPPTPLTGDTIEIASQFIAGPFMLQRVGEYGDLVVYDGEGADGDFVLRCVAVGHEGDTSWSEWCAFPGDSGSFVVVDGIDPWVVDVGAEHLDVTLAQQPSSWAIVTSGCTEPIVTLVEAADIAPAVATSIACAGGEAFLTYSSVFMQTGPPDGGGLLLTNGDEGWTTDGGGTSMDCAAWPDDVDRCQQFGVDSEMFESTSPLPSPDLIAAQEDYVGVREVTSDVRSMAADASGVDEITDAVMAAVTSTDAEVAPTMIRHDGVSFNRYSLLIIDVPAADDSVRSTTWAVWITTETAEQPSTVHRAYAWDNCSRGVADPATCV